MYLFLYFSLSLSLFIKWIYVRRCPVVPSSFCGIPSTGCCPLTSAVSVTAPLVHTLSNLATISTSLELAIESSATLSRQSPAPFYEVTALSFPQALTTRVLAPPREVRGRLPGPHRRGLPAVRRAPPQLRHPQTSAGTLSPHFESPFFVYLLKHDCSVFAFSFFISLFPFVSSSNILTFVISFRLLLFILMHLLLSFIS
jgi:hypothetical protein